MGFHDGFYHWKLSHRLSSWPVNQFFFKSTLQPSCSKYPNIRDMMTQWNLKFISTFYYLTAHVAAHDWVSSFVTWRKMTTIAPIGTIKEILFEGQTTFSIVIFSYYIFWYFSTTFYYLHTLLTMMHRWTDDQSEMKWKQRRMEVCRSWLGTVDRLQSGTFFNLTQIQSNISLFLRSHSTTSRLILEHTSVIAGAQRKRLLILFLALPIFLFLCLFYTRSTISLAQELKRLNKWASQCQKRVDERCAMSRKFCS